MATSITTSEVTKAKASLDKLRGSLKSWLKYRAMNDAILAGTATPKKPIVYAQTVITQSRARGSEANLAAQLHALITEMSPDLVLPDPTTPNAAVTLAQIAINGPTAAQIATVAPAATGSTHPWLWPIAIVTGLLLAFTVAVSSSADVTKNEEQLACVEAGACSDTSWWKYVAIAGLVYFAWTELGVGDVVKSHVAKQRAT